MLCVWCSIWARSIGAESSWSLPAQLRWQAIGASFLVAGTVRQDPHGRTFECNENLLTFTQPQRIKRWTADFSGHPDRRVYHYPDPVAERADIGHPAFQHIA